MHILITGAAGTSPQLLPQWLVVDRALGGAPIHKLDADRHRGSCAARRLFGPHQIRAADLNEPGVAAKPVLGAAGCDLSSWPAWCPAKPNSISTRAIGSIWMAPAPARSHPRVGGGYNPRELFTSSMAVFGAPFPRHPDDFIGCRRPPTAPRAIVELKLVDYTPCHILASVGFLLPFIVGARGPEQGASGFFSGIVRESLAGLDAILPLEETVLHNPRHLRARGRFPGPRRQSRPAPSRGPASTSTCRA